MALTFNEQLEDEKIVEAIRQAELRTSGEIRVYISKVSVEDAVVEGQGQFMTMDMTRTRERNGVLVFVAPASKKFAVIGDEGVHAKCGEPFWTTLTEEMTPIFARDAATEAIVHAVKRVGDLLAEHFPRRENDKDELPNEVERGDS